jgi:hypothetical protein
VFLDFYDVEISPRKLKRKLGLPRIPHIIKQALPRDDIRVLLEACHDLRLKTVILFIAATGCRANEALHLRNSDIRLENNPANVRFRAEITKTRTERIIYLTDEAARHLDAWLKYKYRIRKKTGKEPERYSEDFVFAVRNVRESHKTLYNNIVHQFGCLLDGLKRGDREQQTKANSNSFYQPRRKITFHSIRRMVYTAISDTANVEYANWFIGHAASTYHRQTEADKIAMFRKVEPHLTFLDYETKIKSLEQKEKENESIIARMERNMATSTDIQNRLRCLEQENQKKSQMLNAAVLREAELRKDVIQLIENALKGYDRGDEVKRHALKVVESAVNRVSELENTVRASVIKQT